ncbi:DUF4065 domain-containing protein [Hyphomonadaceae bacterium BL14]|nr:DUF4065 domain-containing protein [Hyphomonadaceae bacterium BL14]
MAIHPLQVGKRLCERSGWTLTNLQLQKIAYIAHMLHLGQHAKRLVSIPFQAWEYGPVSYDLYRQVRAFGADPIGNVFRVVPAPAEGTETEYLDGIYDQVKDWTPGQLVSFTHRADGAWDQCYDPNVKGIVIPDEAIIAEYRRYHG